jgi:hypothetical protein
MCDAKCLTDLVGILDFRYSIFDFRFTDFSYRDGEHTTPSFFVNGEQMS